MRVIIQFTTKPELADKIACGAKQAGLTVSKYVRNIVEAAVKADVVQAKEQA